MDYGKEAYYKVLDIEEREAAIPQLGAATAKFDYNGVPNDLCVCSYSGGAGLICVSIKTDDGGETVVRLGSAEIWRGASGAGFGTVSGATEIKVSSDSAKLLEVTVTAIGNNAALVCNERRLAADTDGQNVYYMTADNELSICHTTEGRVATLYPSSDYDLACGNGCLYAVYIDSAKNAIAVKISDGVIKNYRVIGINAKAVAIARYVGRVCIAVVGADKTTVCGADEDLDYLTRTVLNASGAVSGVAFVKGGDVPTVIVCDGDKNLMRYLSCEAGFGKTLAVTATLSAID